MKLTYEEFLTVAKQIEACLNSRPLYPLNNDIENVLTPGHFIVGEALVTPVQKIKTDEKVSLNNRWEIGQKIVGTIWESWKNDYLDTLQKRNKWFTKNTNVQIGDVVLIKEDNTPATKWPLGLISKTFLGNDNLIRVIEVKVKDKIIKRPIHKLCEKGESDVHQKRIKTNSHLFLSLIMIFFLIVGISGETNDICMQKITNDNFEITPFPNQPTVYVQKLNKNVFIKTKWKNIIYFELQDLKESIDKFEKNLLAIESNLFKQMCK